MTLPLADHSTAALGHKSRARNRANVRFGLIADMRGSNRIVRFVPIGDKQDAVEFSHCLKRSGLLPKFGNRRNCLVIPLPCAIKTFGAGDLSIAKG